MEKQIVLVDLESLLDMFRQVVRDELSGRKETEEAVIVDCTNIISGAARIAGFLGISDRYLSTLRKRGVFSKDAIWQESNGGKVYADPDILKKEFKVFRSNQ